MSVSAIFSALNFTNPIHNQQSKIQRFRQAFQQLGQDLQSGNLSAAQTDFAQLQQTGQSNNPIAQALQKLGQDLQSGNVTAAQQDFSVFKQDIQNAAHGHHRHHHAGGTQSSSSNQVNLILQAFSQLGQDLQAGDLAGAQKAYAAFQQQFAGVQGLDSPLPRSSGVNATA